MAASSAPTALPPTALAVSRYAAEHDLVARIARGQNLLRRPVHGRPGVIAFARDLVEWSGHNRDLLAKRFADNRLADAYSSAAEPFVVPAPDLSAAAQAEMLREQLRHQVGWLETLRATLPDREEPVPGPDDTRVTHHRGGVRAPAVLAASASGMAVSVVGAVARATGVLPTVIEGSPDENRSLLRAAEHGLPPDAVAVVVIEEAHPAALVALGYVAGALGTEYVIVVRGAGGPSHEVLADFATVTIQPGDSWRRQLSDLLEQAGFSPPDVLHL